MKKGQIRLAFLMISLVMLFALAGCGKRDKKSLENELAYRQLGINKMDAGEYEDAVKMFQKALDQSLAVIEDLEIDICYYKAAAQYKAGDSKGALKTYTALIEYDKKNSDARYLRGTMYLQTGDEKKALADYEAALKLDGKNGRLYNQIGENLLQAGLEQKAGEVLNRGLKLKGKKAADFRELGYTYYLLEQYDSARACLDKAVNLKDKEAVFYLAKLCEAQGDKEQADTLYETYIGEHSDDTETLNTLGVNKMESGDYEQALAFFRKALENESPANEQALRRNEIAALEYSLDFAQARDRMKSYLEDYPEDEAAVREYEFLKSR